MQATRPLFIPVVLGTVRQGRASENVRDSSTASYGCMRR